MVQMWRWEGTSKGVRRFNCGAEIQACRWLQGMPTEEVFQ